MSKGYHSLLWSVHYPDHGDHVPSYLYGSIHILDARLQERLTYIHPYVQSCDSLLLETPIDFPTAEMMEAQISLPLGRSLKDYISTKKWRLYAEGTMKFLRLDLNHFDHLKPLIVLFTIQQHMMGGVNMQASVDMSLWEIAGRFKMSRGGLESFEEHYDVIDHLSMDDQLMLLDRFMKNLSKARKQARKMYDWYLDERIDQLYRSGKSSLGKLRKVLLYDRNTLMVERFIDHMKEKPTFAVIGAAHLWGESGMIAQLKRQKFILKPISIDARKRHFNKSNVRSR